MWIEYILSKESLPLKDTQLKISVLEILIILTYTKNSSSINYQ